MKRIIEYNIKEQYNNYTIERFLKENGYSHSVIVSLKKTTKGIMLNDVWAYTNNRLKTGDTLVISIIENDTNPDILPVNIPIDIIYEDEDILVVNKPADMPIHPSINNHENTLANALMYYFNSQNESFTFRCINRLDRDTTGLTIIAKHNLSAAILGSQVASRQIKRTYLAICEGKVPDSGTIDAPIARCDGSTIERCVNFECGEKAVTHYNLCEYDSINNLSLIRLNLETGRTHQIRVHMKYEGFPLIGDFLYNPSYSFIKRQALHSYSLDFTHPVTKEKMHLTAPLPGDMKFLFTSY